MLYIFINIFEKIKKIVRAFFSPRSKNIFFTAFFPNSPNLDISLKNIHITFEPLWIPNFIPNFRKILRAVSEIICYARIDGRTHKGDFFNRGPNIFSICMHILFKIRPADLEKKFRIEELPPIQVSGEWNFIPNAPTIPLHKLLSRWRTIALFQNRLLTQQLMEWYGRCGWRADLFCGCRKCMVH